MAVSVPHFASPFTLGRNGAQVDEQGDEAELVACVYNVAVCERGFRADLPTFGITDPTFRSIPLNVPLLEEQITRWEPRAELESTEQAEAVNVAARRIVLEVS